MHHEKQTIDTSIIRVAGDGGVERNFPSRFEHAATRCASAVGTGWGRSIWRRERISRRTDWQFFGCEYRQCDRICRVHWNWRFYRSERIHRGGWIGWRYWRDWLCRRKRIYWCEYGKHRPNE